MIEIKNLCKTYLDHSGQVKALDNVSFNLPNKGMIFIVGKSGCGKTTLLNILGGLDNLTSGEVLINKKPLSSFSVSELDNYRNTTVGFVFQDFCLIERMSVKNNIKMALEFQNSPTKINYNELLRSFGLTGLAHRKPTQLSAGQKQRVAIARAIVKNPDIILADEPTGNVDEKTSVQIMDILKNISKEKLVVVISHNNDEAFKYGDRIIQMSDGKIIDDKSINNNSSKNLFVDDKEILLPGNGEISNTDLEILNTVVKASKGNIRISQNAELFQKQETKSEEKPIKLEKAKMSFWTKLKFAAFFFKKKIVFNTFIILLITFVTSFFSIVEILGFVRNSFELDRMLKEVGHKHMLLQPYKSGVCYPLDEDKIDIITDEYGVYTDYVYTVSFPVKPLSNSASSLYASIYKTNNYSPSVYQEKGYAKELTGVQVTTNERLYELFGEPTILAGEIKENSSGIIITDYVADSILKFRDKEYSDYQSIVDGGYIADKVDIDAIIKTDIYERCPNLFENWDSYKGNISLLLQLATTYSYGYSLNPNFKNDFINTYKQKAFNFIHVPSYQLSNSKGKKVKGTSAGISLDSSLEENELHLNYATYNSYFGGKFNSKNLDTFKGDIFTVEFYDTKSNAFISKEFNVTKLYVKKHYYDTIHISTAHNDVFYSNLIFSYALSVDTSEGLCYEMIDDHYHIYSTETDDNENNRYGWAALNNETRLMYSTIQLFSTFKGVFKFISYLLIAAIFLIVILNSNTLIKQNVYEIGLMKAFGAKTKELVMMFAAQMFFSSLIVCALLYSSSIIFIELADNLLKTGILTYVNSLSEKHFTFSSFVFLDGYFFLNIGLIAASTITSVIVPIIAVRNIKPLTIIKTKN